MNVRRMLPIVMAMTLSLWAASVTVPPAGEKPLALASSLDSVWRTRRSSATKLPMSGGALMSSLMLFLTSRS